MKKKHKAIVTTIPIPRPMFDELKKLATANRRSGSCQAQVYLRDAIDRAKNGQEGAIR